MYGFGVCRATLRSPRRTTGFVLPSVARCARIALVRVGVRVRVRVRVSVRVRVRVRVRVGVGVRVRVRVRCARIAGSHVPMRSSSRLRS